MTRSKNTQPNGAAIRSALAHPVIDSDAHVVECEFALIDTLKEVAGPKIAGRFDEALRTYAMQRWYHADDRPDAESALAARRLAHSGQYVGSCNRDAPRPDAQASG